MVNRRFWPLEGGREGDITCPADGFGGLMGRCRQASVPSPPQAEPFFQGEQPSQTREKFPLHRGPVGIF